MKHGVLTLVGEIQQYKNGHHYYFSCEPVWPSRKALGWSAEGPRFNSTSVFLSLQKDCDLWILSCDFVPHN